MNATNRRGTRAALVLADGTAFLGQGLGGAGAVVGELVFNTAMTGYQEILTDPSYAGQLITFTFPHIGNVGTNDEDIEATNCHARGVVLRAPITEPSNFRAAQHLDRWLEARGLVGIAGVDTQAHHPPPARYRRPDGRLGLRRATGSGSGAARRDGARVAGHGGHGPRIRGVLPSALRVGRNHLALSARLRSPPARPAHHVVAVDYGIKRNILRSLASLDLRVTVVPATTSAEEVLALEPDGIFLSNGPGDPAATGRSRCRRSRSSWRAASRCSASAWVIRCWRWRSAARPRR